MDPCDHTEVAPNQLDPCGTSWSCRDSESDPHDPKCPSAIINPKEIAGAKKPAIWQVMPRWVILLAGRVMSVGAAKYGPFNYRDSNVSAMTYVDAIERHMQLWQDGEDDDDETGVSHLARQKTGMARKTLDCLALLNARLARILRSGDWKNEKRYSVLWEHPTPARERRRMCTTIGWTGHHSC